MNRRDFLKLSMLSALSPFYPQLLHTPKRDGTPKGLPNILIIVFDAWTAKNISLYGYQRETTPNITRLAEKAIVFHNHYAAGPFTAPGTASILTGQYPWKHRVLECGYSLHENNVDKSIFSLMQDDYYQIAYTHNPCADVLLHQQEKNISAYFPRTDFYIDSDYVFDVLLSNDYTVANLTRQLSLYRHIQGLQSSLFIQWVYTILQDKEIDKIESQYPYGLPRMGKSAQRFLMEDISDWLIENVHQWTNPFLGYFHFLPPHAPYNPRKEFVDLFKDDGYEPLEKEIHPLSTKVSKEDRENDRQHYDEFIRFVDSEFLRIYKSLEEQGILEDTWVILTSDHGESFERGEYHHATQLLFEPVIKIPLLIFKPGLQQRIDIHAPTSNVDILPTIMKLAQKEIPDWAEGAPLPFSVDELKESNPLFAMNFQTNEQYAPLEIGTISMIHEGYKIMKLMGYSNLPDGQTLIEIYDLANDPEELNNLANSDHPIVDQLRNMLDEKLRVENLPFQD